MADGSEAQVLGTKICTIQFGAYKVEMEVLVTEKLNATVLLGLDFLEICPTTKTLIEDLHKRRINQRNLSIKSN